MRTGEQRARQTEMAKLIVAFAILRTRSKNCHKIILLPISGPFFSREGRINRSSEDAIHRQRRKFESPWRPASGSDRQGQRQGSHSLLCKYSCPFRYLKGLCQPVHNKLVLL